jgi:hypothetical protein
LRARRIGTAIASLTAIVSQRLVSGVKHTSAVEIYRTRETKRIVSTIPAVNVEDPSHHISRSGIILRPYPAELDIPRVESLPGLLPDGVLTSANRIIHGELAPSIPIPPVPVSRTLRRIPAVPDKVERVDVRAALRIVDLYYRHSAVSWIPHQTLATSAADSRETKLAHIRRHLPHALKPAPLWQLPSRARAPENSLAAADFHLRRRIHNHFHSATAPLEPAPADDIRAQPHFLFRLRSGERCQCDNRQYTT